MIDKTDLSALAEEVAKNMFYTDRGIRWKVIDKHPLWVALHVTIDTPHKGPLVIHIPVPQPIGTINYLPEAHREYLDEYLRHHFTQAISEVYLTPKGK